MVDTKDSSRSSEKHLGTVGSARAAAVDWVMRCASKENGFMGAYFTGSTIGMPENAPMSPSSDIDVMVVSELADPPLKPGKFIYRDTLIEGSYISIAELSSVQQVLVSHHLAGPFRVNTIISDPQGHLHRLYAEVSRHFADQVWVRRRCENILQKIKHSLLGLDLSLPLHDLFTSWLFPTGITTHVLLLAALKNPTVRLRYAAARDVVEEYGLSSLYPELLRHLGCADLEPERAMQHVRALERTFDKAAAVAKTPFFFSSDISPVSRPIAIDGSITLIEKGLHREAVFWMGATFARCHKILAADSDLQVQKEHAPGLEAFLADLGFHSVEDFSTRAAEVIDFLPELWRAAEAIMESNPDITGRST
ncbi:hypothetical protein [Paenibacillus sp. XY044]|uniref:hypothetical protein n=1 Tax=Paenibacillus sp. XY044 TaxID=2026089 RepID=UPI000B97F4EE|nr:hypothetical protein [Paenibacillus sp. XY044]OZB91665.1 hypothetical protein CJP46_26865 [Paenibacillus sp. XY044]